MKRTLIASFLLTTILLVGCGPTNPTIDQATETPVAPTGPKKVSLADLPPLGHYLPVALDEGRVKIAPPEGWAIAGRSTQYLARFTVEERQEIPRIIVTAKDAPGEADVSEDNVEQFADTIAARLAEEEKILIESVKPLMLGDRGFARYVIGGKFKSASVERQMLETVVGGRLYLIDLTVYSRSTGAVHPLVKHRDEAYAVAAGLDFSPTDEEPTGIPPTDEPTNESKPATESE